MKKISKKNIIIVAFLTALIFINILEARRTKVDVDTDVASQSNRWTELEFGDLLNLSLIAIDPTADSYYSYKVRDVFPEFKNAPAEVLNEFAHRMKNLSLRSEQIYFEQQRVRDMLTSIQGTEDRSQVETLEHINQLIAFASGVKRAFYKELGILRNIHYEHHHEYDYRPYPREIEPILSLCQMVVTLQELQEIIPQDAVGVVGDWRQKIDQILARDELKPFLEKENLLRLVRIGIIDPSSLNDNQELQELFKELENIWETDQTPGGGPDKHSFLRQLPDNVMNNLLGRVGYYSYAALMMARDGAELPNVDNPDGTIHFESYKNPIVSSDINVVPVTINIDGGKNVLLLSGPNMGGKTTTARGVAFSVIFTQMGLPVPSNNPELAIFNNIHTVFPSSHQISPGFGYFSSTVRQITELISKVQPGDLIILDEVPAGTEYTELVAIATVLIEDLIATGATVVVTGHLKKAFELIVEHTGHTPMRHTMAEEDGRMVPDYGLEPGIAGSSYAIEMTHDAGFPAIITELARTYYRIITEGEEAVEIPEISIQNTETTEEVEEAERSVSDIFGREPVVEEHEMIAQVINNLYPQSYVTGSFAFMHTQDNIMEILLDRTSGIDEYLKRITGSDTIAPEDRLGATEVFIGLGKEQLEAITALLKDFKSLDRAIFRSSNLDQEVIDDRISNLEGYIKYLLGHIGPVDGVPLIGQVAEELNQRKDELSQLRSDIAANPEMLNAESEAFNDMSKEWSRITTEIMLGLVAFDFYSGIAKKTIEHSLNKPEYSEDNNVFSLNGSIPFSPDESFLGRDPFLRDPKAQSFTIDPNLPVVVVTGPNSSGKTVLNFNCWMNALFAKHGFYVSGDFKTSHFDNVLAFFGGRDKPLIGESYFRNLLGKYANILNKATPNSLIILDELHGSDNFELAAIQLGVLHYLRELGCTVIFNTHIRDGLKLLAEEVGIDFWQTNIIFNEEDKKVEFLYTLSPDPNLEAKSYGLEVARPYLNENQIERIEEIIRLLQEEGS